MRFNYLFAITLGTLMMTSCSQEENELALKANGETIITARLGNATTRATASTDDAVTRCLVQVREQGSTTFVTESPVAGTVSADGTSCSFTVSGLTNGTAYDFLFWADDASYTASNLTAIEAPTDKAAGIAYAAMVSQTLNEGKVQATLNHAVTKITLNTTAAVEANKEIPVKMTILKGFDVSQLKAVGTETEISFSKTLDSAVEAGSEVLSFYALPQENPVTVQVGSVTINNVPMKSSGKTTLQGDVSKIDQVDTTIEVDINTAWGDVVSFGNIAPDAVAMTNSTTEDATVTIPVAISKAQAADVTMNITVGSTELDAAAFNVPASVTIAAGQTTANLKVTFNASTIAALTESKDYTLPVTIASVSGGDGSVELGKAANLTSTITLNYTYTAPDGFASIALTAASFSGGNWDTGKSYDKLIDGDEGSFWQSAWSTDQVDNRATDATYGVSINIDLGAEYKEVKYSYCANRSTGYAKVWPKEFILYVSNDGSEWTAVSDVLTGVQNDVAPSNPVWSDEYTLVKSDGTTFRHMKMAIHKAYPNLQSIVIDFQGENVLGGCVISEIKLQGKK